MAESPQKWCLLKLFVGLIIMGFACLWSAPAYLRAVEVDYTPAGHVLFLPDFFQEWSGARNRFAGLPVYTPQEITVERYLGKRRSPYDPYFNELNAHPPSAVLLGVPFAAFDFEDAFTLWNMLSFVYLAVSAALIFEHLGLAFSPWDLPLALGLLLLCNPFWHQMVHGQLNLLLLLLLTGAWVADRQGQPNWAGALVGVATAIKLYPGFLFVYFLLRRDGRAIRAGVVTLLATTALTALVLGPECYHSYFLDVLPWTSLRRADWHNLSLSGVWCKLFEAPLNLPPVQLVPLRVSPTTTMLGIIGTCLVFTGVLATVIPRLTARKDTDLAFSLTLIAMLLVSPITWDHYLLVLALPLAVLWLRTGGRWMRRLVLLLLAALLWFPYRKVVEYGLDLLGAAQYPSPVFRWVARPPEILTVLSVPCYAILGLLVLTIRICNELPASNHAQAR
jgi:hypothetical protein